MLMLVILVLGQSVGAGVTPEVPPACQVAWARAGNAWERAKRPDLLRYCDLVGNARAKLGSSHGGARTALDPVREGARTALDQAREAEKVMVDRADAFVLEGRALVALGDFAQSVVAFRAALDRDARAVEEPAARLAWARALARTGQLPQAADVYRSLQPRIRELRGADRQAAELEVGLSGMTRGRADLDDAVSSLRAATREGNGELHAVAILALALALDRRGDVGGARDTLTSVPLGDPRDRVQTDSAKAVFAVSPADAFAASALALETSGERQGAHDAWLEAIEGDPTGPWVDYAKAHVEVGRSVAARRP